MISEAANGGAVCVSVILVPRSAGGWPPRSERTDLISEDPAPEWLSPKVTVLERALPCATFVIPQHPPVGSPRERTAWPAHAADKSGTSLRTPKHQPHLLLRVRLNQSKPCPSRIEGRIT